LDESEEDHETLRLCQSLEKKQLDLRTLALLFEMFFYRGLHLTYMSFLFPVIARDLKVVLVCFFVSVFTGVLSSKHAMCLQDDTLRILEKLQQEQGSEEQRPGEQQRGKQRLEECVDAASSELAARMFTQLVQCFLELVAPVTFMCILAFNHYSYNRGMFYVLSSCRTATSASWPATCR